MQACHGYLAHELGHHLGLMHPMGNEWPLIKDEATKRLDAFCDAMPDKTLIKNDKLADMAFDADGLSDTPGDTGGNLYANALYGINLPQNTPVYQWCIGPGHFKVRSDHCRDLANQAIAAKFAACQAGQGDAGDGIHTHSVSCKPIPLLQSSEFDVHPQRDLLMSYYSLCSYTTKESAGFQQTTGSNRARLTPQEGNVMRTCLKVFRSYLPGQGTPPGQSPPQLDPWWSLMW